MCYVFVLDKISSFGTHGKFQTKIVYFIESTLENFKVKLTFYLMFTKSDVHIDED